MVLFQMKTMEETALNLQLLQISPLQNGLLQIVNCLYFLQWFGLLSNQLRNTTQNVGRNSMQVGAKSSTDFRVNGKKDNNVQISRSNEPLPRKEDFKISLPPVPPPKKTSIGPRAPGRYSISPDAPSGQGRAKDDVPLHTPLRLGREQPKQGMSIVICLILKYFLVPTPPNGKLLGYLL